MIMRWSVSMVICISSVVTCYHALSSVVFTSTFAPFSASTTTALPFSTLSFLAAGSVKPPVDPNPPEPLIVSSSVFSSAREGNTVALTHLDLTDDGYRDPFQNQLRDPVSLLHYA